jgi:hypothetical protein
MAMTTPISGSGAREFIHWGTRDREHFAKFWRNAVYWLTEKSHVARRRLIASTDKRFYRPGETVLITAVAFDENAIPAANYRMVALPEPKSTDGIDSDYSPLRRSHETGSANTANPFVAWGEELELTATKLDDGLPVYTFELSVSESLPASSANPAMLLELTAYDGTTQVDSTSVPIQILCDPFEGQNPFPNHELLRKPAERSGGEIHTSSDSITQSISELPTSRGPTTVLKTPLWSQWPVLVGIFGLMTGEWCLRRFLGLG